MSRCKCCDIIMSDKEIVWKPELRTHEDLCSKCLKAIDNSEQPLTTVINEGEGYVEIEFEFSQTHEGSE